MWKKRLYVKFILRPFNKLSNTTAVGALRDSFVIILPIMVVGSFATLINNLPVDAYQTFMNAVFGKHWLLFGMHIKDGTFAVISVLISCSIGYNMASKHNQNKNLTYSNPLVCSMVCLAALFIIMHSDSGIRDMPLWMSSKGLFAAVVVSLIASGMFIMLGKVKLFQMRYYTDETDYVVTQVVNSMFPAFIVLFLFSLFKTLMEVAHIPAFYDFVYSVVQMPFLSDDAKAYSSVIYVIALQILWFFGMHGANILEPVASAIYSMPSDLGKSVILDKTFFDVFVFCGGSGATISMLIAMLGFAKRSSTRKLGRVSVIPAFFNINEVIVFGLPMVLNPLFFIPFIICPLVMFVSSCFFMKLGLVPAVSTEVVWTTPPVLNAYISTGSFRAVLLQLFNIVLGVFIYMPFLRAYDRSKDRSFKSVYKKLVRLALYGGHEVSERTLVFEDENMGVAVRKIAADLKSAIRANELQLYYQIQAHVTEDKVLSVEALLRWKHPYLGMIPPPLIIAVAEDSNLISELGLWVVEQAAKTQAEWRSKGLADIRMAVNSSVKQLADPEIADKIMHILNKYDIPPELFEIEVTEAIALSVNSGYSDVLQKMHDYKIKLAIDDFGMGHSTLLYLRQFHVDVLKVDASLSRDVIKDKSSAEILVAIVALCKSLNTEMVVEFVDNKEQLEALIKLGARIIQGYYFGKPLPPEKVFEQIVRYNSEGLGVDRSLLESSYDYSI